MRRRRRIAFSFGVLALLALAASCVQPTQITLRVTSDVGCSDLSGVQLVTGPTIAEAQDRFHLHYAAAVTHDCTPGSAPGGGPENLIGTLVVTPGGSGGTVVVSAGVPLNGAPAPDPGTCEDPKVAPSCIIARRSFSFIEHTSLTLPIELSRLCVGKTCDPASTCFRGTCVDATVTCKGSGCGLAPEIGTGAGGGTDASSSDGAYDADLGDAVSVDSGNDKPDADAGDSGSKITDAGPDAKGGGDAGSAICGNAGMFAYCYAVSGGNVGVSPTGVTTSGTCANDADKSTNCCRCTCASTMTVVSCDVALMSSGSCHPTCP